MAETGCGGSPEAVGEMLHVKYQFLTCNITASDQERDEPIRVGWGRPVSKKKPRQGAICRGFGERQGVRRNLRGCRNVLNFFGGDNSQLGLGNRQFGGTLCQLYASVFGFSQRFVGG